MMCLICRQAEAIHGLTSVTLEREEMRLAINKVPALICTHCGEAYVSEEVAGQLLQDAETVSQQGILEVSIEYNDVAGDRFQE